MFLLEYGDIAAFDKLPGGSEWYATPHFPRIFLSDANPKNVVGNAKSPNLLPCRTDYENGSRPSEKKFSIFLASK